MSRIYLLSERDVRHAVAKDLIKLVRIARHKVVTAMGHITFMDVEIMGGVEVVTGAVWHGPIWQGAKMVQDRCKLIDPGDTTVRIEDGRTIVRIHYISGPEDALDKLMRAYGAILCGYKPAESRHEPDLLIYVDRDGNCLI